MFKPFRGAHYSCDDPADVGPLTSPPYDVFDERERAVFAAANRLNIVHVDYPVDSDGPDRYLKAAQTLRQWADEGWTALDTDECFYIYRLSFTDGWGRPRRTVGVIGALQVVDPGSEEVLPHEQTTPKAKTDRLELTRATRCNLSAVWGLALASGLSVLLDEPGDLIAQCLDESGVLHSLERIAAPDRLATIQEAVSTSPVLIADGHHRYAVSRTYRDECRDARSGDGAELTMTFIQELEEEQLSIEAIHRLYDRAPSDLAAVLEKHFIIGDAIPASPDIVPRMRETGQIFLLGADGEGRLLTAKPRAFEGLRALDSVRLEHALHDFRHTVAYQHGYDEVQDALRRGDARSAVLINPVGIEEIRRTATTGELMPPKSTFFTPKLRTGLVWRPLDQSGTS